jgi:GH15 family glucan-1,4-alpha-glucosidase
MRRTSGETMRDSKGDVSMDYPPIADHGLIGDLQTAALVATDGTVDWLCLPRFDSPSVFASLLDRRAGGRFALAPVGGKHVTAQMYLPNTAVLVTRFLSESGVAEVADFMPISNPCVVTDRHRLIRQVTGIRGTVKLTARVEPRFDYGRAGHKTLQHENGVIFDGSPRLSLSSTWPLEIDGDDATAQFTIKAGEIGAMILDSGKSARPAKIGQRQLAKWFDETVGYWRDWLAAGTYRGRWREAVERSAMALKLMQYAPSGGMVAAPTAGLPEQVGGERNWDYRYTWIRDASFSVEALLKLGFTDEAVSLGLWIRDRLEERAGKEGTPLGIMYRVDGSSDLSEETLDHFEGYRKSRPVRIGNGASDQLQLDIYGEAMDSLWHGVAQTMGSVPDRGWRDITKMLDWLAENWNRPDEGIWETRGGQKPFMYGRMMTWVAFDRAIKIATTSARPGDLQRWTSIRDELYETVMTKGWNRSMKAFVQYEGSDVLDASMLLMPAVGLIVPTDEKWRSTLAAMDKTLVSDSLVYRYDPKASPDGLAGSEGTFSLCTFFYVDALTRTGRLNDAQLVFEKMLTYANHLGLFSEEIGLTGEQLGNFPQAFTHLSLINAAVNLDKQLDLATGTRIAA